MDKHKNTDKDSLLEKETTGAKIIPWSPEFPTLTSVCELPR